MGKMSERETLIREIFLQQQSIHLLLEENEAQKRQIVELESKIKSLDQNPGEADR